MLLLLLLLYTLNKQGRHITALQCDTHSEPAFQIQIFSVMTTVTTTVCNAYFSSNVHCSENGLVHHNVTFLSQHGDLPLHTGTATALCLSYRTARPNKDTPNCLKRAMCKGLITTLVTNNRSSVSIYHQLSLWFPVHIAGIRSMCAHLFSTRIWLTVWMLPSLSL